ncbi:MAG: hypothetical protein WAW90_01140 [Minisyncoccia bacterium]
MKTILAREASNFLAPSGLIRMSQPVAEKIARFTRMLEYSYD